MYNQPSGYGGSHHHPGYSSGGSLHSTHSTRYSGRPAGYGYQQQQQAPAGTDPTLWAYFTGVDTDHSGSITANELQQALVNGTSHLPRMYLSEAHHFTGNWTSMSSTPISGRPSYP